MKTDIDAVIEKLDSIGEPAKPGSLERRGCMADLADICNSAVAQGVATALVILAILLGLGGCIYLERTGQAQVEKAREK